MNHMADSSVMQRGSNDVVTKEDNDMEKRGSKTAQIMKRKLSRNVNIVDRISRGAFPLVFILLNCVYWTIYMS